MEVRSLKLSFQSVISVSHWEAEADQSHGSRMSDRKLADDLIKLRNGKKTLSL